MNVPRLGLAVVGALIAFALPAVAQANEVTKWNSIALNTVAAQPPISSAPNSSAVFMAMTQGAVYGAVNSIDNQGRPMYLVRWSFPLASKETAVATAAYRVLDTTFPAQHAALKAEYDASLANIPDGLRKSFGVEAGKTAAAAMLRQGHDDARMVVPCSFGAFVPGVWQPLADPTGAPVCDPSAWVKDAKPFLIYNSSDFRTAGPYPLGSAAYAADYNEVKELGSVNSTTRTPLQSRPCGVLAIEPGPELQPPGAEVRGRELARYQRQCTAVRDDRPDCGGSRSSLPGATSTPRLFWRPMAAIRHGGDDGNPATVGDPTWTPLFNPSLPVAVGGVGPALNTPPYPEHPSGAVTYASATMHAFQSFFGTDDKTFYVTSSRFPGEQLSFDHFSALVNQVVEARIWAGIHFRNADVQAANLGREIQAWTHAHYFLRPLTVQRGSGPGARSHAT